MHFSYFTVFFLHLSQQTLVFANEQTISLEMSRRGSSATNFCGLIKNVVIKKAQSKSSKLWVVSLCLAQKPFTACECKDQTEGAIRSSIIDITCRPTGENANTVISATANRSSITTPSTMSVCQCPSPVSTITLTTEPTVNTRINSFISDTPSGNDNASQAQNKLVNSSCQDHKPLVETIIIVVVTSAINLVLFLTTVFAYRKYKLAQISIQLKPTGQPNRKSNLESTQTRKRTNNSPKILSSETDKSSAKSKTIITSKTKSRSITTATPDLGPDSSEIKSIRPLFLQAQQIKENPAPNPKDPNPPTTSRPITIETDIPTKTANKMNSKAEEWKSTNENQNIKDLPIEIMKGILRHKKREARK